MHLHQVQAAAASAASGVGRRPQHWASAGLA